MLKQFTKSLIECETVEDIRLHERELYERLRQIEGMGRRKELDAVQV